MLRIGRLYALSTGLPSPLEATAVAFQACVNRTYIDVKQVFQDIPFPMRPGKYRLVWHTGNRRDRGPRIRHWCQDQSSTLETRPGAYQVVALKGDE